MDDFTVAPTIDESSACSISSFTLTIGNFISLSHGIRCVQNCFVDILADLNIMKSSVNVYN